MTRQSHNLPISQSQNNDDWKPMRIILASPETKVWSARKHIPLGLGYLAGVLREGGHDVIIYDAAIEDVGVDYYLDLAEAKVARGR